MKILQAIVLRLLSLLVLAGGVLLIAYTLNIEPVLQPVRDFLAPYEQFYTIGLIAAACIAIVFGFFGLIPLFGKPNNTVHFENPQGSVVINVRSLERYLGEVLVRMPEVEAIDVDVVPIKKGKKVRIEAHAKINQPVTASGRATSDRVTELIKEAATSFIGLEEDTPIHLTVDWIDINVEEASQVLKEAALPMPDSSRALPSYSTARLQAKSLSTTTTAAATPVAAAPVYQSETASEVVAAAYVEDEDRPDATGESVVTPQEELSIEAAAAEEASPGAETKAEEEKEKKGKWGW